jgi:hypothetical protein
MYRRLWILAVAMVMGLTWGGVAAQDASPAAGDFVTPDPAACTVAPRTVDELRAFIADATAVTSLPATPVATGGEPADAETAASVSAVTHEIYSCLNANAFLRMFTLYSDAYIARSLVTEDVNPDALELFATPIAPQDADERTSIAIREVAVLPDGRVSVLVTERNPLAGNAESSTIYIFVDQDGRWLVDDIVLNPAG